MTNAQALKGYVELIQAGYEASELDEAVRVCRGSLTDAIELINSIRAEGF